tara:strand:- start:5507 stop:5881 length:375 start_codon:yes stop_codon:yes gene_type:complete
MTEKYSSAAERKAAYQDQDFVVSSAAAPTIAEMNALDAKDPEDFFNKLLAKEMMDNGEKAGMADGGMARGKGNKMYQHNYATGGSVTDNLKPIPADNKGLPNLPKSVRNKMGYMKKGGAVKGRA